MRGGQGHAQACTGEHHDDARRVGLLGQVFSMAGERNAGVVDRALVHGAP